MAVEITMVVAFVVVFAGPAGFIAKMILQRKGPSDDAND